MIACACVCVYPQRAEATESLQHAVVYVLQSVGGQNQLIDPRGSLKRPLLYVGDTIITQVTAKRRRRRTKGEREEEVDRWSEVSETKGSL